MNRHRAAALWLALALGLPGCGIAAADEPPPPTAAAPPPNPQMPDPQRLTIPALGVFSTLIPLGLNPDGSMQVPPLDHPEQAGWYAPGPEPGEIGDSIILGHVNGHHRLGVFAQLGALAPGDVIDVDNLQFTVDVVFSAPKTAFPTTDVFTPTDRPELRLISCGGTFDRAAHSYPDNVIVAAHLTSIAAPQN